MLIAKTNYIRLLTATKFWTVYNRFKAGLWQVSLGKNVVFCGKAVFHRAKESHITIGDDCMLISDSNSRNLVGINRPCIINTQSKGAVIEIGAGTGMSGTVISARVGVKIGQNVKCGANTLIIDSDWHPEDPRSGLPKPIDIGDNVWLGAGVIVLKGVQIGVNTVIGANSVVTKSIPANVVAGGNPCKIIKSLIPEKATNTI